MAGAAVQARPPEPSQSPLQLRLQQQQQVRRPSMDGQDRTSYGGSGAGGGGKARSAGAVNRRKTPYDRPAQGRHASGGPQAAALLNGQSQAREGRAAWLGSGLVGTASKFLTSGASYLLSSVFRRRPNAPLSLTYGADTTIDEEEEPRDGMAECSPLKTRDLSDGPERASQYRQSEGAGTSNELNTLLLQQTLSSEEYARLTQLLQSRVVDNGVNKEHQVQDFEIKGTADGAQKHTESGRPSDTQRRRDQPITQSKGPQLNGIQNGALENSSTTPGGAELNNGSDSPVEIARAFMGERVARGPGSASPGQGQKVLDGNVVGSGLSPLPATSRALVPRVGTNEVPHNIFQTPPAARAFRGLPGSTYTPYSRPVYGQAARELTVEASQEGAAPSRWTPIRVPVTGGPQSLKRRSTALDDGWASVGPIRRTRRKSLAASTITSFGTPRSFGLLGDSHGRDSPLQKTPFRDAESGLGLHGSRMVKEGHIDQRKSAFGPSSAAKVDDQMGEASRLATVPVQSTETARKILETLDRITSSPKGKLLDDELALINSRPQPPLTMGMLNDHAQRSMQDPGFLTTQVTQSSQEVRASGHVFGQLGESGAQATSGMVTVRDTKKAVSTRFSAVSSDVNAETKASEAAIAVVTENEDERMRWSEPPVESGLAANKKDGFRMNVDTDGSDSDHDAGNSAPGVTFGVPPQPGPGVVPSSEKVPGVVSESLKFPPSEPTKGNSFGGFTFPVSASLGLSFLGNSMEPPPTPKAIPSPAMNGGTSMDNASGHVFQFGTGPAQSRVNFSAYSTGQAEEPTQAASLFGLKESQPVLSNVSSPATFLPATQPQLPPLRAESKSASIIPGSNLTTENSTASGTVGGFPSPTLLPAATDSEESQTRKSLFAPKPESAPLLSRSTLLFGTSSSFGASPFSVTASKSVNEAERVNFGSQLSASGLSGSGLSAGPVSSTGFSFGLPQAPQTTSSGTDNATGLKVAPVWTSSKLTELKDLSSTAPALFTFPKSDPMPSPGPVSAPASTPALAPASTPVSAPTITPATGPAQPFATPGQPPFTFSTLAVASTSSVGNATPPAPGAFGNSPATPMFGAASVSSSGFGLGAPSSTPFGAGSASVFGSGSNSSSLFTGFTKDVPTPQSSAAAPFGSAFGASPAPNSLFLVSSTKTETTPFAFGSSGSGAGASASGGMFQFSASVGTPGSTGFGTVATTGPISQPTFGVGQPSPAFGGIPGNGAMAADIGGEHTSMDDMAEEPIQPVAASAPLSIFQQPSGPPSTFVFGQPSVAAQSVFPFSQPQPNSFQAGVPNPFAQPSGALDFGGGGFSLGSGGSEPRPGRRIIKPKRTGSAKRGK